MSAINNCHTLARYVVNWNRLDKLNNVQDQDYLM